ncbi:E3 ubiquitin-protein ligase FANCL-like isoform X1 [Schistocerca gregaria]|uniref:E3 ubiquitin-protein ligase FANCL-like isoform X1 n=1 Tax=Schistocerca gregaria TaxID=7010 RepID=UPI00211E1D8F|nr:E3 ubiquitin-protein ligase FANCL-like isoform X1 [Schistocerca gregaria]XP_049840060.1 E3 ubiquitin-protein ligase FANCL-like isoform X1 [Schistocerca gregaria]
MDDQLLILKNFPLLVPHNREFTFYDGFIRVKGAEFRISLNVPHYPALKDMHLKCSWDISALLRGKENAITQIQETCHTLHEFLEALCTLTAEQMSDSQGTANVTTRTYINIMEELASVNPAYISHLSVAQQQVVLQKIDSAGRKHYLSLSGIGEPSPRVSADLPQQALAVVRAKGPSVGSMYRVFCQQVASLQRFWTVMQEVDSSCWVIDPEEPNLRDTARRIIIGENVSLQLQVNPWDPCSRPDIKFLGPEKTVSEFRERLIYRFEEWDSEMSLPDNLKSVLGFESFPEKPEGTDEDEANLLIRPGECFVCFSVRLEGSLPSEACPSERCGSIFHMDCLYQLLMSLPTSHRSFNRISGECPSCGAAISCPIPG